MVIIEFFRDTLSGMYYFIYAAVDLFLILLLVIRMTSLKKRKKEQEIEQIITEVPEESIVVEEQPLQPVIEQKSDIPSIFMQQKAVNEKYKNKFSNTSNNINQNNINGGNNEYNSR